MEPNMMVSVLLSLNVGIFTPGLSLLKPVDS